MVVWGKVREVFRVIVDKCNKPTTKVVVLGFYDRGNIGDEQYKITIPLCFTNSSRQFSFEFVSIDDAKRVDDSYDIVMCGGGDIINAYFMEKVKRLVVDFTGRIYAISVGIPYDLDACYLDLFDHVFVRNNYDARLATCRLGAANVTRIPDIGFMYPTKIPKILPNPKTAIHIGLCLATPVYRTYAELRSALPRFIHSLLHMSTGVSVYIHFFHFNSFEENTHESDFESTLGILSSLSFVEQRCCTLHKISKPERMIESLKQMTFNVCMRYHSVVFSLLASVPFIVLYANKKVKHLLEDLRYPTDMAFDITNGCDWLEWTQASKRAVHTPPPSPHFPINYVKTQITSTVISNTTRLLMVGKQCEHHKPFDEALSSVKSMLDAYFGYMYCTKEVVTKGRLDIGSKDPLQVARVICYAITGNIDDPCIWGLSENMQHCNFSLYEAIQYIHANGCQPEPVQASDNRVSYYPRCELEKRIFVTIDPFTKVRLSKNVHRSGWAYVLSHMMNLNAPHFQRPHRLVVDTYMDRTFHWGMETMMLNGVLPYRTNWVGFLHHTFDSLHSKYNCIEMFKKQEFRESLGTCKGIIVLSNYLARQVRAALKEHHLPPVEVHVIYHPTEFVKNESLFTFSKFMANPNKKIVQIGAWLRNPYAIYKLPVSDDILNPLGIRKAVLKGKNMDGYFASNQTVDQLINLMMRGSEEAPSYTYDCISRDALGKMENKYVAGLCDAIRENHNSVEIISDLSNDDYDDLLASNIVFLQLQDCSAVNTVIECIVRNTILIVNRHPALEEMLGEMYPGFYDANNLVTAALILNDIKRLERCHIYLKKLDKSHLRIETFMKRFVDIILGMVT
jgi:hypothetical protein